jgi:hypothetical protein
MPIFMLTQRSNNIAGKVLILAMVAGGISMAGFSWWFRYLATHRAAHFWGSDDAQQIRDATRVEMIELKPATALADSQSAGGLLGDDESVTLFGHAYDIIQRRDVSRASGMTHLRNALLEDNSFAWSTRAVAEPSDWHYALQFRANESRDSLWLFFTHDFAFVARTEPEKGNVSIVTCGPKLARGLRTMFAELLPVPDGQDRAC